MPLPHDDSWFTILPMRGKNSNFAGMKQEEFINKVLGCEQLDDIKKLRILVTLSGGADSVALLRVLLAAGCHCRVVHCNFHLRDEESMRDERFVRDLCDRLAVPLTVKDFDVKAWQQEHGGSTEMACRELRYQWFEEELERQSCDRIAVAHHSDDQVETFFLNLLRGTGSKGLSGMKRLHHDIWRPLLSVSRQDILDYLDTIGQDYVTDSTNAHNDYRRNRLRNLVLPVIEKEFPGSKARILDTMQNLADDFDLMSYYVESDLDGIEHIDIKADYICEHPYGETLLYHRIRERGFNREQCAQAIEAARRGHTGRIFTAGDYVLAVNREKLSVDLNLPTDGVEYPIDLTQNIVSPISVLVDRGHEPFSPRMCSNSLRVAFNTRLLDCKRIVMRHWRQGDRIRPFGMKGTKLVSDLFNELKLDYATKKNAWLLEADGDIIWVVGQRSTAHYPVENGSQDYLILTKTIP